MGCYSSKCAAELDGWPIGTAERVTYPSQSLSNGARVHVSAAGWAAGHFSGFSDVHVSSSYAFAALFDKGQDATTATDNCRIPAYKIFCSNLLHSNGNVSNALQKTFTELDAKLKAASPAITKGAKGGGKMGITGMLVLLDFTDGICYMASSQNCGSGVACGTVLGAFHCESPQAGFLGGFPWAVGESEVKVTTQKLGPSDRHLILGSAGLWQIITAEEAGLRLYASAMMPSRGRNAVRCSALENVNPAEMLVLFAQGKLARGMDRHMAGPSGLLQVKCRVSLEDLRQLQVKSESSADAPLFQASPMKPCRASGPHSKRCLLQKHACSGQGGNVAAVVISINWEVAATGLATSSRPRNATNGWAILRTLCTFERLRRQRLMEKWWTTTDLLLAAGAKRALHTEQAYWRARKQAVHVTPSGRVYDCYGRELNPSPSKGFAPKQFPINR